MSLFRESLFDLLLNVTLQIALFAVAAAALARFIAKARARHQHAFYLGALALCLAAPVINTVWHTHLHVASAYLPQSNVLNAGTSSHFLWSWTAHPFTLSSLLHWSTVQTLLLSIWALLLLAQSLHFVRAVLRVRRVRQSACSLSPAELPHIHRPDRVALLRSTDIEDPITIGVVHPAIILPAQLLPALGEDDLSAVLAHECAHIRRKDFLVHLLCQLFTLPVAWHPGIRFLLAKITHTRELACDEDAAVQLGKRSSYARTLLRLASLGLQAPRNHAVGLSIFDGDNLEDRIMSLIDRKNPLTRSGLIALGLAVGITFGCGAALARAMSVQTASASSSAVPRFSGTWHWMFKGRSFSTMQLIPNGTDYTGSVTGSKIALDNNGELSKADPTDESSPAPITRAVIEGNALHITVMDDNQPFEFLVTLKDDTHAEIHPVGAPPIMKPIQAEKVR